MGLFLKIMLTEFIAEMGDKTQFLMIAMTSKFKLRDIIIGAGVAILVLNGMAVGVGALISQYIPMYVIKIVAALAFFYFAYSGLKPEDDEEEELKNSKMKSPILAVFGTFFLAELGDKTQLTAITFAANEGLSNALIIWLACSVGLFAADVIGMLVGYLLKSKLPVNYISALAFVIFAIFGVLTMHEGCAMLWGDGSYAIITTVIVAVVFAMLCGVTVLKMRKP